MTESSENKSFTSCHENIVPWDRARWFTHTLKRSSSCIAGNAVRKVECTLLWQVISFLTQQNTSGLLPHPVNNISERDLETGRSFYNELCCTLTKKLLLYSHALRIRELNDPQMLLLLLVIDGTIFYSDVCPTTITNQPNITYHCGYIIQLKYKWNVSTRYIKGCCFLWAIFKNIFTQNKWS